MTSFEYKDVVWTVRPENGLDEIARPNIHAVLWDVYEGGVTDSPVRWGLIITYTTLVLQATATPPPKWLVSAEGSRASLQGGYEGFVEWLKTNAGFVQELRKAIDSASSNIDPK